MTEINVIFETLCRHANFRNHEVDYFYCLFKYKSINSNILTAKLDEAFFPGILMAQGKTKFRILCYGNRSNLDLDKLRCSIEPKKENDNMLIIILEINNCFIIR